MIRTTLLLALFGISMCTAQPNKLLPVEIKGKWGYMDLSGEMRIQPQYDLAGDFSEGLAVVALNNLPCVINRENKRVVDTGIYQGIAAYSEGLSFAKGFDNSKVYLDNKGQVAIRLPDSVYDGRPFRNGLAVVGIQVDESQKLGEVDISRIGFRFGYINKKGELITGYKYEDADDLYEGLARYKLEKYFGLIDSTGKEITKARYALLDEFFEGLAVYADNGKFGYINKTGEVVIKPTFDLAFDFNEGKAGVLVKKKYGYIDSTGKIIIQPQYEQIRAFSEGLAAVQLNGKWGFINPAGEWVILPRFDNATVFLEGYCAVFQKHTWGFINKSGQVVIPIEFDAVGSFSDGVADVLYHDVQVYLNKRGEMLPKLRK